MRTIKIFDTTLRDGEQTPNVNLNIQEKVEIARFLENLGVDIIEAGFAIASNGDFEAISAVAREMKKATVASLCRARKEDIDRAWEAVKHAVKPRLHTFLATSDIHMKYKLKMDEEQVLAKTAEMVAYAKTLCSDVEFSAEDATRTRPDFLVKVFEVAIKAGANVINVPDTVGYTTPAEFGNLIKIIRESVPGIENVEISVHCHNDLGMATANSLVALENGATQVECTINGLGERAGNAALEEIVMALRTRNNHYGLKHNIDTKQIHRTSRLVSSLTGVNIQPNKAIVGSNAFAHESGIHQHGVLANRMTYEIMTPESVGLKKNTMVLGKLSGRHAFEDKLKEMGYNLNDDEIWAAFEKFKDLADKKKDVLEEDIEAIVEEKVSTVASIFELNNFQISSGNKIVATAMVSVSKDGLTYTEAATGDGPIDAAFNALERATGTTLTLEEYNTKAVTGGKDALGEVSVRVVKGNRTYVGRGLSTDVIEASVKAYMNAINRSLMDMNQKNDLNEGQTV